MCSCNNDGQTKSQVKNFVMIESRGLKREVDSMKPDEYTNEAQYVVGRISAVEFDLRLLRESRQTEIDFVNQLDVYRPTAVGIEYSRHSSEKGG